MKTSRRLPGPTAVLLKILFLVPLTGFMIWVPGCDAPRRNPMDPANPDNGYCRLTGSVQSISIPRVPLSQVSVYWPGYPGPVFTDAGGRYSLETFGPQENWIFFEKDGFFPDSSFIAWQNPGTITTDVFLNQKPHPDSLQLYSVILNRYPSLQTEQAVIAAWISDSDNDIDSVKILPPAGPVKLSLPYNTGNRSFERTFSVIELGTERLDDLVGYPWQLVITDLFGHTLDVAAGSLTRVIREEVHFRTPSGNETTGPMPVLTWEMLSPGFHFTYILEIFTADLNPELQWRTNGVDMAETAFQVDTALPPGPYFWVIWAVDDFGNRTRSKPASFTVAAPEN